VPVVAVAGLPGCGKSTLTDQYVRNGYECFDNFNQNWDANMARAKDALRRGENVLVTDIEFCGAGKRQQFESQVGSPVQWVFFENDPYQCAKNVLHRAFVERRHVDDWTDEMQKIKRLSEKYVPQGDVRPVVKTPPLS
jgi:hypothetical protein